MDRRIRISLIVVVVLALAYPAAAWFLGLSIEREWNAREQHVLQQIPYITVVKRDYRRGIYSSTEEVTYGLGDSILKTVRAAGQDWANHAQFSVRNTVHHGPLPQMRAFAPATVDTEIMLPPELRAKLADILGKQGGLTIHTRMKWFGGGTTLVESTSFQVQLPQGGEFAWRGLDAKVDLGRNYGTQSVTAATPGFSVKNSTGNVNFGTFKINSDMQLAFEALNVGTGHMTLSDLDIEAQTQAKPFKLTVQGLVIDTTSQVSGEFINNDFTLSTGAVAAQKFAATGIRYDIHLDHVHGPSASTLVQAIRAAQAEAATSFPAKDAGPQILEAFKKSGVDVLAHDPILDVRNTGFTTPDGELVLSLKAALPGITRADLDVNPQLLTGAVLKFLQASVDVRIDTALLDKLLDSSGQGDTIAGQLQGLQRQGYIKLDGKALTTHLNFQGGRLTVNDLPFPPMPSAMPGGPGGPGMPAGPGRPGMPGGPGMHGMPPATPRAPSAPH